MPSTREIAEGIQGQGADETIHYRIACTPAPVAVIAVAVHDENTGEDVTAATMPAGTATIDGRMIDLPGLTALEPGHLYRIEVRYSDGKSTLEPYALILGEK